MSEPQSATLMVFENVDLPLKSMYIEAHQLAWLPQHPELNLKSKALSTTSLKLSYWCVITMASQFLCLESEIAKFDVKQKNYYL